jgi:serine/threonine protein kinase
MAKLDVKEIRGQWRDPRADETSAQPELAPGPTRAPRSTHELMAALGVPAPPKGEEAAPVDPSAPRDLFGIVGTTQDVFEVERVVAHGGFSVIYKATHTRFAAPAALKLLKIPPTLRGAEREDFLLKFKKEGELMFRLSSSCPEIVRPLALDAFRLKNREVVPYIALEWLEGSTLKDTIVERILASKPPLSPRRAVSLLTPVARALSRAHNFPSAQGRLAILHCDLKPDNIFVAKQDGGEVIKIFDFGIAKVRMAATREAGGATSAGVKNMFTPAYAAPEQWTPEQFGQTGAWTDVYALAITLGEVLTQRPALEGSAAAMLTQCLDPKKRPTPRALGLEIDDDLDDVFRRALAVDPRDRTRSVEDFWGELEDALDLPRSLSAGRASMPLIAMPVRWDDDLDEPPRASSLSVKPPGPSKAPSAPPPVARAPELPSLELPAKPTAPEPPPPADAPTPRPTPPPPEPAPAPAPTAERSSSPQPVETSSPTEAAPAPAAAAPAAAPQPSAAPAAARQARPPAAYDVAAVAVGLMIAVVAADAYAGLALPVAWICTALALVAGIVVAVRFLR